MNTLNGIISEITTEGSLSLVKIKVEDTLFTSIIIDTPETLSLLNVGNTVTVLFKETEVIISKTKAGSISLQNILPCTVQNIKKNKLLCQLTLTWKEYLIDSIITTTAFESMNLQQGSIVYAMIKTNEILLAYD